MATAETIDIGFRHGFRQRGNVCPARARRANVPPETFDIAFYNCLVRARNYLPWGMLHTCMKKRNSWKQSTSCQYVRGIQQDM